MMYCTCISPVLEDIDTHASTPGSATCCKYIFNITGYLVDQRKYLYQYDWIRTFHSTLDNACIFILIFQDLLLTNFLADFTTESQTLYQRDIWSRSFHTCKQQNHSVEVRVGFWSYILSIVQFSTIANSCLQDFVSPSILTPPCTLFKITLVLLICFV